ncbi:hypothetical protein AKJ09_03755 [Labilithrix luteola]|uniref:Uncharacterized protein n=1 Tax=Labilithrix luteola TaxID=1391654 RepID=A0A0K1PUN4_9BACT|nr:porin [Labilithrix luteola]AKU97091.1 hypothetical protein AKJ09_03755 [Labilithrix luteola]
MSRSQHTPLCTAAFAAFSVLASPAVAFAQATPTEPPAASPPASTSEVQAAPSARALEKNEQTEATAPGAVKVDNSPVGDDSHPLAGYHNGIFYLRDPHDNFNLFVQGRAQIDFYSYAGSGVSNTALKPTLFLRRIRPEITGDFLGHFRFMLAGDFGATGIDNPRGTNETSAAAPGAQPGASTARFAAAEATRFSAAATDVFLVYYQNSLLNVQVGQFDAPFTMENRTSDKYIPFMERSLAVRAVGIPSNKEIGGMVFGETKNRVWYYSAGLFNGDGQNRPNVDSRGDLYARTFVKPLAGSGIKTPIKDAQIGGSFHYGSRDPKWVEYDYAPMITQAAWQFWSPVYNGSKGPTHVIPSGNQFGVAGELRIPVDRFDFTGEVVWIDNNTREAVEGFQATNNERFGDIHGISYYAQVGYWPFGQRDITGLPGYETPPRIDWSKPDAAIAPRALQLLAKWEQVSLNYQSASRAGTPDSKNIDGDIRANALSFGANYWASRHIRLSLNYVVNMFPDSAPASPSSPGGPVQTSNNRAVAPGNTIPVGVDNEARNNAHTLHEILMRFAVAL